MASLEELQAEFERRSATQPQAIHQAAQPISNLQALEAEFSRRQSLPQQPITELGVKDDGIGRIDSVGADSAGAGVSQGLGGVTFDDIDQAFQNIPGVPALTEFAAGANRSIFGFLDFLGPDNINAALELAGSEKRVPTLTGEFAAPKGQFSQDLAGRALGTAGELAPTALGIGQSLRTLASSLPKITAGESALTGTARQLGAATPTLDVVSGTASGAGQEVGREVGGETGALIGGIAAPLVAGIPLSTAKSVSSKLLKQAAPTADKLKDTARQIYNSLDESGVSIQSKSFDNLADDIARTLKKEGADPDLTQKAVAVVNRLLSEKGANKTLTEIDTLRKVARGAADSLDKSEARLGNIAINKIDEFLDGLGADIGGGKEAGQAFRSARDLWQRARKSELLDQAVVNAESQASGFENGLRTQFRQLLKRINTGKQKGFTKEETAAIKQVVDGTKAGNLARFLGKFGILDGVTSRSLTTLGGAGLAGAAGGPGAAAAVPLIGQVSGALAQRMTANNARMANNLIKAGKNSKKIVEIYMKNTPKTQRSPTELAELFLKNKIPVESVNLKTSPRIVSDAAIIASVAKINDERQEQ